MSIVHSALAVVALSQCFLFLLPAFGAQQLVTTKTMLVKNPPSGARKVLWKVKETAATIMGNPISQGGATLRIQLTAGGSGADQCVTMPASGWSAIGTIGFKYKDATLTHGPVKVAQIKKTPSGTFLMKALLKNGGPTSITITPGNPTDYYATNFTLGAGDEYCGGTGSATPNPNDANTFKVSNDGAPSVSCIAACGGTSVTTTSTTSSTLGCGTPPCGPTTTSTSVTTTSSTTSTLDCGGTPCGPTTTSTSTSATVASSTTSTTIDLMISEIVNLGPLGIAAAEFVEIYNRGAAPVSLDEAYLSDNALYYLLGIDPPLPTTNSDFVVRFPAGATIAAGEYQTISIGGIGPFQMAYGVCPTYTLTAGDALCPTTQSMRSSDQGLYVANAALTNAREPVVLFLWDGASDLVGDVDYVYWGTMDFGGDSSGVFKGGVTVGSSTYNAETPLASQSSAPNHVASGSIHRCDLAQSTEGTGGNGVNGTDVTSETWATAFAVSAPPASGTSATPGAASPAGLCP